MAIRCLEKLNDLMQKWIVLDYLAVFSVFVGFLSQFLLQMVIVPFLHIYGKYVPTGGVHTTNYVINASKIHNTTNNNLHLQILPKNFTQTFKNKDDIVGTALLFASTSIAEVIALPIIGTIADRIDYQTSYLIGVFLALVSAVTFPFGTSYTELILSRITLGIGAGFIITAGYGIILESFKDPVSRTNAVAIVTYAIYFGGFAGAPIGGFLYHLGGVFLPYIVLASLLLFTFVCVFVINRQFCGQCLRTKSSRKTTPLYNFLVDPHIMISLGVLFLSNVPVGFLCPVLSTWMSETMGASEWQIGMTWIPTICANTSGTYLGSKLTKTFPRYFWLIAVVGQFIVTVSAISFPFIRSIYLVMVPMATVWFGVCLIDTSVIPYLGYIVDTRYNSVYGGTFSLMAMAYALASALSGVFAGIVMQHCGFLGLNVLTASCNLVYIPLLLFLRKGIKQPNDETTPIYKPIKETVRCPTGSVQKDKPITSVNTNGN